MITNSVFYPPPQQDARDTEIKDLPSLEKMVSAIPQVAIDRDEDLTADFKAEKISAETVGRTCRAQVYWGLGGWVCELPSAPWLYFPGPMKHSKLIAQH